MNSDQGVDPNSINQVAYSINSPFRFADYTGNSIYLIEHTTGNTHGDAQMKLAAETRARDLRSQKGFNPLKDVVMVRGVKTVDDMKAAVKTTKELASYFGKVKEFSLYSHASESGAWVHTEDGQGVPVSGKKLAEVLSFDWEKNAKANFFGCRTGRFVAPDFATATGVAASGLQGYGQFSTSPSSWSPSLIGQPDSLYMVDPKRSNGAADWLTGTDANPMTNEQPERDPCPDPSDTNAQ